MTTAATAAMPKPAHKSVRVGTDGSVWIEGYRCDECGAVVPESTFACRACACRTPPAAIRAAETGKLYSWSVVHRSYPGVAVPFVSAIVDLDDGLTLKGTLRDVAEDELCPGLLVRVAFDNAGGALTDDGAPYQGFHFLPAGATS
jgi:uncharacterized protein